MATAKNPWEATRRTEKARRLVDALVANGVTVSDAQRLDKASWDDVAKAAGTKPPSAATVAEAIELYRIRHARAEAARPF